MKVKELIKKAVEEKVKSGNEFSAFDVLIEVRDMANNRPCALVEDDGTVLPVKFIPEIGRHSYDLRYTDYRDDIFDEINQYSTSVRNTSMCRMFKGATVSPLPVQSKPMMGIRVAGGNAIKYPATVKTTLLAPDVKNQVRDYLRKVNIGGSVTVKQVQSDLKRGKNYKSIPSDSIKRIAKEFGYKVDENSPIKHAKITR